MIRSGDVENVHFQGEKPTTPLLLSQPRGGIPDDDVSWEDFLLALVLIYGTKAAGRSFWKRLRMVMRAAGLKENFVFKACCSWERDGVVMIIIATHVDDLVWACRPEAENGITKIKSMLTLGVESEYSFRYCGKEIEQDKETFSIEVTCKATPEKNVSH